MNKIRYFTENGGRKHFRDENVPFVPAAGDRFFLPTNNKGQLGEFTCRYRQWTRSLVPGLEGVICVCLVYGDGRRIYPSYDLGKESGWNEYDSEHIIDVEQSFCCSN